MALPAKLTKLADAFSDLLFETDCLHRISHHMARVAPENWLATELAYLFNTQAEGLGAKGWSALVERKRVDITLVPPGAAPEQDLPPETSYLELKLVATDYWNTAWREVQYDLTRTSPSKPTASYSVCLLSNVVSEPPHPRLESTRERHRRFMERVPMSDGWFEPVQTQPRLYLEHTSPQYVLRWKHPVLGQWPEGYEAVVRVLWVSRGPG